MSEIVHTAIITSVIENKIKASFERNEACGNCALKAACGQIAEQHEVMLQVDDGTKYAVGQKIEIVISGMQAFYAAFWGYILPLLVVLATMFCTYISTADEIICAALSLFSLGIYYIVLFIFRKYFKKTFQIRIR